MICLMVERQTSDHDLEEEKRRRPSDEDVSPVPFDVRLLVPLVTMSTVEMSAVLIEGSKQSRLPSNFSLQMK